MPLAASVVPAATSMEDVETLSLAHQPTLLLPETEIATLAAPRLKVCVLMLLTCAMLALSVGIRFFH